MIWNSRSQNYNTEINRNCNLVTYINRIPRIKLLEVLFARSRN